MKRLAAIALHIRLHVLVMSLLLCMSNATAQMLLPEEPPDAAVVEQLFEAGRKALREGDLDAAARAYEQILQQRPDSPEALYQMAIYYFRKQDYVRGFELIRRAIEISPDNPFPRLALAKGLTEVGDFEAAIEEYQRVLELAEPGSRPAQNAELEMQLAKFRQATRNRDREQLREVGELLVNRYPNAPSVLELVANIYVQAGIFNEARDIYFTLLRLVPDNPQIEFYLGSMYEMMRDPDKAIVHFERAMEKGRGTPIEPAARVRATVLKGISLSQAGERERAHQLFLEVLEQDEYNVIANMNVAGYLVERRELEAAKQAYLRVLERQPENLDAHFRLAVVYLDLGDTISGVRQLDFVLARAPDSPVGQAAQRTLEKVGQRFDLNAIRQAIADEEMLGQRLRQNPNDVAALTDMGDLLVRRGRREEAIAYFERAIQTDPEYGEAHFKLARAYDELRRYADAAVAYQRALTLISDATRQAQIRERLAAAQGNQLLEDKQFEQAEEHFRQAYEMAQVGEPREPRDLAGVLWGLAMSNSQQGDLEEAARWYEELITLLPGHVGARINAAFVYEQLEEEERASAHYNAVRLEENAPPELKQRAIDRLDYIRRQTNGVSYAVGYAMGFDDNLNSARTEKFFEYRSDLFASAIYRYKLRKGMKLALAVSPTYTIYHRAEFDFFNFSVSPTLLFEKWGYDWNLGMSRNTQSSVLRPEQSSTVTDTFSLESSWITEDRVGYRANLDYRGFNSSQNPFFDADTINLGLNANFVGPENTLLSYGYSLTVNNNKNQLGNDYAYTGHGVNGRIDKRFDEALTGYLSGRLALNLYQNPDSSTNFQRYRRTFSFGVGGGINYRIDSWVSFFASYNYMAQYSNLPVGLIFNELQAVEGRQSTSLGSFVRHSIGMGIRMNF